MSKFDEASQDEDVVNEEEDQIEDEYRDAYFVLSSEFDRVLTNCQRQAASLRS